MLSFRTHGLSAQRLARNRRGQAASVLTRFIRACNPAPRVTYSSTEP